MNTETKKTIPAYTTYTAFTNLISDLRENNIPSHVTRSVIKGSNSGKAMMMASLKYLDLINKDSIPTDTLVQLVENDDNYSINLKQLLLAKYPFLFDETIDIKTTTTEKVAEKFQQAGAQGSTVSKCMAFFLGAAKAAELEVSPRVKAPKIVGSAKRRKKLTVKKRNINQPEDLIPVDDDLIPEGMERITVPLRGMEDGVIFFPDDLDEDSAKRAITMTTFILNQFYGVEDE